MKINKPFELVKMKVFDKNGNSIGLVDKVWNSWNQSWPGCFFGLIPNENVRNKCFRGTYKLVPISSDHIGEVSDHITLSMSIDELYHFWNKTAQCGPLSCTIDKLLDKPVFDKNHSKIGIFFAMVEGDGSSKNYGLLIDPYLCDIWKVPYNTLMPIPTNYITNVKDTITLDKTLDDLKNYWKQHFNF
jgi:hypothetical protein